MRFKFCCRVLFAGLLFGGVVAQAEAAAPEAVQAEPPGSRVVMLTDRGIEPSVVTLSSGDNIVFFLNDSSDSLASLEVEFGSKVTHCASANLKILDGGTIRSTRPFGPRDFATICFPEKGAYRLTVYGLKSSPRGLTGSIVVE